MTSKNTTLQLASDAAVTNRLFGLRDLLMSLRNGLIVAGLMLALAYLFKAVLDPIIESAAVEQTVMTVLAGTLVFFLPFFMYVAGTSVVRPYARKEPVRAVITAVLASIIMFGFISAGQYITQTGPFGPRTSLGFTLGAVEGGAIVEDIVPDGPADEAGLQVGDIITAVRRDPITKSSLLGMISRAEDDAPLRLRLLREGEEMQLTARTRLIYEPDIDSLLMGLLTAFVITIVAVFWPGGWTPYVVLILILAPLLAGYLWLIIATFSTRTEGLLPLNNQGGIGGFTLNNWSFLAGEDIAGMQFTIWRITFNSFAIAIAQMSIVLLVSSMTGYALSRMHFAGRKGFLSFTLILHGFPQVTLLIPVFFVLRYIGNVPVVGDLFGFNTVGGIALAMVAGELPLGVWLMKGFFDNIPWDMERSAFIDGASRWRTYWQILLPQIRPGILALGIFSFVGGWNAFLIPQTYSLGTQSTLAVFMRQLIDETAPVDWNQVAAVGLYQLIPIFFFFIFAQEYLLNIYAGGTKGTS